MTDEIMKVDVGEWNIPNLNSDLLCDILERFTEYFDCENGYQYPSADWVKSVIDSWWCDDDRIVVFYNVPVPYEKSLRGREPYDLYAVQVEMDLTPQELVKNIHRVCKMKAFL